MLVTLDGAAADPVAEAATSLLTPAVRMLYALLLRLGLARVAEPPR